MVLLPGLPGARPAPRTSKRSGFHRFFETTDSVKHRVSGPKGDLDVMIVSLRAPADGPIGDSGLVLDDGETGLFNMNDARPVDLDVLARRLRRRRRAHAAVLRGHLVPDGLRHAGRAPRRRSAPRSGSGRWTGAAEYYRAGRRPTWVIPSAGPPCFLDPALRDLNDDHGDPANIFPDQVVFLEQMRTNGHDGGC